MKRLLFVFTLALLCTSLLPALSVRAGVGAVSSIGLSMETKHWDFDLDVRSVTPVLSGIGPKIMPKLIDENATDKQWRSFSAGLFNGLGTSASYKALDSDHNRLEVGLDLVWGIVKDGEGGLDFLDEYEKAWVLLVGLQGRYTFKVNEHNGFFISGAYPFAGWMHVFGVPGNNDAYSIDSALLIPYTLIQLGDGLESENLAKYVTLGLIAATVRVGYAYTF